MANKPNNPSLWSRAKSLAKQKFDVYPSAYANGWAAKWYKGKGGTWRKAQDGMQIPYMESGGKPEWLIEAQLKAQGYNGNALQQKLDSMAYGGNFMMQAGGNFEPNGGMALGQMAAVQDKMNKLRQFVNADDNLDPWIASKLAVMDHSADAIADYLMYGDEGDEIEETDEMEETEEMKEGGGIPPRYKNMGFTKVGAKRQSNRPGKKWMVLAKKGSQYKVVHGGYKGMKDFTQHGSEKRRKNFWNRMGGKNSSKATDPFSPLYWHKRFGTWKDGGMTYNEVPTGDISIPNLTQLQVGGYFPRFMEEGGSLPKYQYKGPVSKEDSVKHQANKILQYEQLRGGPGGTPLGYYSDPKYMQMLMQGVYPEVKKILPNASAMEMGEAMDFIFNAGWDKSNNKITKDPRAFALQEYYRQYDPSKLDKDGKWSGRKNPAYSFDEEYNATIGKLPENDRRVLMNKGRDWYYKNINNPAPGVPNSNYFDTWYGRIWNTNDYNDFDPNNPMFIPKRKSGGLLPQYQTVGSVKIPIVGFGKRCAIGSDADGNCIGGERAIGYDDMQKQLWKERTNLYEGLKGDDKRARKAAYEAALAENPGLTPEMYAMADWDAWSHNSALKKYKDIIDPNTGMVPDSATVPSQFKYFINNKLIQNSGKPATYKDMLNIYNQLEGGFEQGYKPLFMSGFSQQKKNGGINNPGFKALPERVQKKIISRMEDGGYSDTYSGGVYYQQGGMPQQEGGQQEQIMQLIQAYAQIAQIDPNEVMQQLQQMQPEEQQQALQQMVQAVQQASGGGGQEQMQQPMEEQPQMKSGGMPCYGCGGMYQDGGQMGGYYMPGIPAVSVYDLPIYQEEGLYEPGSRWHPEWGQEYSDSALSGEYDEDAAVAQANAQALSERPGQKVQLLLQQNPGYQGNSIVDYLASAGSDSSYASRKALANQLGISNYRGTAAQNLELLDILRGGKKTIPTGRVTAKSAAKKAENNSSTSEAEESAFTYDPNDGNVLRGGWDRSLPSFKGDFQKPSKSASQTGNNNLAWAGAGLATLIGAAALTAKELAEVKQAFLNNDFSKSFAPSVKRKLTIAKNKLASLAYTEGDKAAMEAVNEFDRLPKRLRDLLSNLDEMEIAGDIYQTRKGTASKGLETWNALNEARAEESILNQQELMRMEQEAAEEAKAIRSNAGRKAAATRFGKNATPAQVAAEENAFMRAMKAGYGAMRQSPAARKAAQLLKFIRKEDGGYIDDIDMMQVGGWNIGGYDVPDWMKTGVQIIDPTGISSYGDVYDTWNDPNAAGWEKALAVASALPIVGKFGKAAKIGSKVIKPASKASKVLKTTAKILAPIRKLDAMNPIGAGVQVFNRELLRNAPRAVQVAAGIGSDFNQGRRFFTAGDAAIDGLDNMMGYIPQQAYGGYMDPAWMAYGGININPANKGKFTASAQRAGMGVQEFANKVLANKEDYSATQVKRANFARNAAKWKKQDGGSIGVGSYVDDTPEMRAWLDANGYTYE